MKLSGDPKKHKWGWRWRNPEMSKKTNIHCVLYIKLLEKSFVLRPSFHSAKTKTRCSFLFFIFFWRTNRKVLVTVVWHGGWVYLCFCTFLSDPISRSLYNTHFLFFRRKKVLQKSYCDQWSNIGKRKVGNPILSWDWWR